MHHKKLIITGAVLVLILAGGSLLYQWLSGIYAEEWTQDAGPLYASSELTSGDMQEDDDSGAPAQDGTVPSETAVSDAKESNEEEPLKYLDVTLPALDGTMVSLSDFEGESAFVLNFWASWCVYCVMEMPLFEQLEKEYADRGIQFIMINVTDGQQETEEKARQCLEELGLDFQHVLLDVDLDAAMLYGASSLPVTYLFDKNGVYVRGFRGMAQEESFRSMLDELAELTGQ